jgi:hypothetical protein
MRLQLRGANGSLGKLPGLLVHTDSCALEAQGGRPASGGGTVLSRVVGKAGGSCGAVHQGRRQAGGLAPGGAAGRGRSGWGRKVWEGGEGGVGESGRQILALSITVPAVSEPSSYDEKARRHMWEAHSELRYALRSLQLEQTRALSCMSYRVADFGRRCFAMMHQVNEPLPVGPMSRP